MGILFVGDDWAQDHHDVYLMGDDGKRLAGGRLPEGLAGLARLHEIVADYAQDPAQVVIGIETDHGLWVQGLLAAGYQVYSINPLAAARYRDRHHLSGAESDAADAKLLADLVRTDRHNHTTVATDSCGVEGIKVLARAHQSLIWARTRHANQLRDALREYFPAALTTFDDLTDRDTLAVLSKAPNPDNAARLTRKQIVSVLRTAGRQRNLETRAQRIQDGLRSDQLAAPTAIVEAYALTTAVSVSIITEMNRQIIVLEVGLAEHFERHPDADIYRSLPGLGETLGPRVLGEFGDDPNRYATAKCRKNYAGTSPLTIASGKKRAVIARYVRNRRLYDAIDRWAFCSLTRSPGCRVFYDERRQSGDSHHQALRALGNRLVGILHGCQRHHTIYDENTAWAHRTKTPESVAA